MKLSITPLQERDTAFALILVCLICWLIWHMTWLIWCAMAICVLTMIWSKFMYPFALVWFGLALALGKVMSTVLLTLVWLVMVVPVGLLRRMMGKDSLNLNKWRKGDQSLFETRDHTYTDEDLKHLY